MKQALRIIERIEPFLDIPLYVRIVSKSGGFLFISFFLVLIICCILTEMEVSAMIYTNTPTEPTSAGEKIRIPFRQIPLFAHITDSEIKTLLHCMQSRERSYKKNEIIILEEEHIRMIGIVLAGRVHMIKEDMWSNKTLLAYMQEGELFGETFAVKEDITSHVSFVAATDVLVLFIPASNIIHQCPNMCAFHTTLSENMFHLLGRKNLQLMEKIEITSKSSLREKILAYLSMLAQKQRSTYVISPLSRTELAEYLGSNRSAMTRELTAMRSDGIIDYDGNCFRILA